MLGYLGTLLTLKETGPSDISQFLEITNNPSGNVTFICKSTNPKPIPHNYLLYLALMLRATTQDQLSDN